MKILHIIFSLNTGGSETMLVDILNEQVKTNKVELIVVNNTLNDELTSAINKNIAIHFIKRVPASINPFKLIQFNFMVYRIKADVIHFHNHNAIRLLKYKIKANTFLTVHTVNVPAVNFNRYTRLFSISEAVKNNIYNRSGANSIRVYNGIDFAKIKQKRNYAVPGEFNIVQVSRLDHEIKGQHILLKSLYQLVYQFGLLNLKIDLIGEGQSLGYLKDLVEQYKLTQFVHFLGNRDRTYIYNNLKQYDLLIQPSIHEGFGLTIVEGIAAGLPIIVTNIDGPAEIVKNIPWGWLFQRNDPLSLSKAIVEVIELYKTGDIESKCRLNYLTAIKKFSIHQTAHSYINNYI